MVILLMRWNGINEETIMHEVNLRIISVNDLFQKKANWYCYRKCLDYVLIHFLFYVIVIFFFFGDFAASERYSEYGIVISSTFIENVTFWSHDEIKIDRTI